MRFLSDLLCVLRLSLLPKPTKPVPSHPQGKGVIRSLANDSLGCFVCCSCSTIDIEPLFHHEPKWAAEDHALKTNVNALS